MTALALHDVADLRRWMISAAVVVLAHATIATAVVAWRGSVEPEEPAGAIEVEFAQATAFFRPALDLYDCINGIRGEHVLRSPLPPCRVVLP